MILTGKTSYFGIFHFTRLLLLMAMWLIPSLMVASQADLWRLRDTCRQATQNSDHRRAVRAGAQMQREAQTAGNDWFMAQSLYYQGISNVILGNSEIGKSQLDKAYKIADGLGDDTLRLSIHNGYGVYEANFHANYASAQRHFYQALEYAVKIGDPFRQALVESNLAETASIRRDTSGLKYALSSYEWGVANDNAHLSFAGAYVKYDVWRLLEGEEAAVDSWTKLTDTPVDATAFEDLTWSEAAKGMYRFAVKAIHTDGNSSYASFSAAVPRLMTSNVAITFSSRRCST